MKRKTDAPTVAFLLNVDAELDAAVRKLAEQRGQTISTVWRLAMLEFLERQG